METIKEDIALTGVAQWIECQPASRRVTGSIPTQGTYMPGFRAGSPVGDMREATDGCFSPSLSPSLPLSLKVNKIFFN